MPHVVAEKALEEFVCSGVGMTEQVWGRNGFVRCKVIMYIDITLTSGVYHVTHRKIVNKIYSNIVKHTLSLFASASAI